MICSGLTPIAHSAARPAATRFRGLRPYCRRIRSGAHVSHCPQGESSPDVPQREASKGRRQHTVAQKVEEHADESDEHEAEQHDQGNSPAGDLGLAAPGLVTTSTAAFCCGDCLGGSHGLRVLFEARVLRFLTCRLESSPSAGREIAGQGRIDLTYQQRWSELHGGLYHGGRNQHCQAEFHKPSWRLTSQA